MSSAATLNPTLPEDLVSAAHGGLTEYLGSLDEVLCVQVGVDRSFADGSDFDPEVTVRYADGTTATINFHRTPFHEELIALRDDLDDAGHRLRPFSIRFRAPAPAPVDAEAQQLPSRREAAYLDAARTGTLATRAYRSLGRGAEDRSSLPGTQLGPLPDTRVLDLGWLRYAEHGFGLVLTDAGRTALAEHERNRLSVGRALATTARKAANALATGTARVRSALAEQRGLASTALPPVSVVSQLARVLGVLSARRAPARRGGRHR
ncbi:hypothetical protein [Streptacidiphilus jiangxiensis]|uniref:Uncharacterized protein n=1 Tax=Streptacidiphilus jiangxiensis TaxID=235985 RepID=A0A1H8BAU2_STRJI|nr:hypothetical protein [Streptacidiphilus jiangxiensis]SEM79942.1 hypothetical protein SAMN05414137_16014 [Streptacidiphilus jiangxiensis]